MERSERSGLELVAVTGPQKPESTLGSGPFRAIQGGYWGGRSLNSEIADDSPRKHETWNPCWIYRDMAFSRCCSIGSWIHHRKFMVYLPKIHHIQTSQSVLEGGELQLVFFGARWSFRVSFVRYVTLDNGGTPFVVRILSRGSETTVTICVRKREHVDTEAAGRGL